MEPLELFGIPHSNFVWACRICAEEKGVPYSLVPLVPQAPQVQALNPLGKIPVMRHDGLTLFETRAIIGYLDTAFEGPALLPRDTLGAALAEQWMSVVGTATDRACIRDYVVQYAFPALPGRQVDHARIAAAQPDIHRNLALLEAAVAQGTLVPQGFTAADALLVPILYWLRKWPEGAAALADHPGLTSYLEHHMARPTIARTEPPPPKRR